MKRGIVLTTIFLGLGLGSAVAQDTNNSSSCTSNSSISHEAVRAGNFKDAYKPWQEVIKECPTLRFYTFTDGYKLLKGLMKQAGDKNSAEYKKYFDELMATHDLRIKVTPEFLAKGVKVSSQAEALGVKAVDYMNLAPQPDPKVAYGWLKESVEATKGQTSSAVIFYFLQSSLEVLKKDASQKEQFIQDYLAAAQYVEEALAAETKEKTKENLQQTKDNLVALFINSGTADCNSLQAIYEPKIEAQKDDVAYLKKVIDIMRMMKCTESDAYLKASYYVYKMEPTPDAAVGCAYMAYKKGNFDEAVKFFDEAIKLEPDQAKRAEKAYAAATILAAGKKYAQAKSYCLKAISLKDNYGQPYILLANLYASNPNWNSEPALNKVTYFVAIDKLQRAKAVDPSVADEANGLISKYSAYTPKAKDLFMLGYKQGDRVTVGGWIGETTTIR